MTDKIAAPSILDTPAMDVDVRAFLTESAFWFAHHWVRILIAGGIAALIVVALIVVRRFSVSLCTRDRPGKLGWWKVFGRTLARTNTFFIVMTALQVTQRIADPPLIVMTTIQSLFTIAMVFQGAIWARELILGGVEHHTGSERYSGEALHSAMGIIRLLVTFAVFAIALVVVLDNLGINVTGLVAGLGVGGIAIGLAAQGIFADLFAALAIVFDAPFRRGDTISYDNTTGTVEDIGLKSTRLRSATGEERIISNKQLLDKEIQNFTQRTYRRAILTIALARWTPAEKLRAIPGMLRELVEAADQTFIRAGFVAFGTSSHDFQIEFDSPSAAFEPFFQARHEVGLAIIERLNAEGIELAYPGQTAFTGPDDAQPDGTVERVVPGT